MTDWETMLDPTGDPWGSGCEVCGKAVAEPIRFGGLRLCRPCLTRHMREMREAIEADIRQEEADRG